MYSINSFLFLPFLVNGMTPRNAKECKGMQRGYRAITSFFKVTRDQGNKGHFIDNILAQNYVCQVGLV